MSQPVKPMWSNKIYQDFKQEADKYSSLDVYLATLGFATYAEPEYIEKIKAKMTPEEKLMFKMDTK